MIPGLALLVLTAAAAGLLGVLLSGVADRAAPVAGDVARDVRGVTDADELRVSSLVDRAASWPGVESVSGPRQIRGNFLEGTISVPLDVVVRDDVTKDELTALILELCGASRAGLASRDDVRVSMRFDSAVAGVTCTEPSQADAIGALLYDAAIRGEGSGLEWVSLSIAGTEEASPPLVRIGLWPVDPADGARLETEWSSKASSLGFSPAEAAVRDDPVPRTSATGS
ncbi:hypothetical protein ACFVSK_11215 [Cellulosimicrobium cellulans]|uniref:hypothetical protein n=1 Tax=Cellulosimicrobium cellulans TaxID=1710 RepID=UPI0036E8B3B9